MLTKIIIIGILGVFLSLGIILFFVEGEEPDDFFTEHYANCIHQGYSSESNFTDGERKLFCIFDDGTFCETWDFQLKQCGEEKVKEFPKRKYKERGYYGLKEECEEGLAKRNSDYLLGQGTFWCDKPNGLDYVKKILL